MITSVLVALSGTIWTFLETTGAATRAAPGAAPAAAPPVSLTMLFSTLARSSATLFCRRYTWMLDSPRGTSLSMSSVSLRMFSVSDTLAKMMSELVRGSATIRTGVRLARRC